MGSVQIARLRPRGGTLATGVLRAGVLRAALLQSGMLPSGVLLACLLLCQCSSPGGPESGDPSDRDAWLAWEDDLEPANGSTFILDPATGSLDSPGTAEAPLPGLAAVVEAGLIQRRVPVSYPYEDGAPLEIANPDAPIRPGDTLLLRDGHHGDVRIVGSHNEGWITIRASEGATPVLSRLELVGVERYRIQGLTIRLDPGMTGGDLLEFESHGWQGPCRYLVAEDCDLASVDDASGWGAADWDERAASGIDASGDWISVRRNTLRNVNFGISASGDHIIVEHNVIENFCGDGLRGNGNDQLFAYNTVMNCYDVNENHDDGFQSFSVNGAPPRERITLRGNLIIGYSDPDQPLRGTLQGIGCFDGFYVDWVVENNVVATDHWHGITFLGADGCRIVNNTVVDLNDERPGPPWIMIDDHKDGRESRDCLIRNNIAASISAGAGVQADHNLATTAWDELFVDYAGLDLHLAEGSPAVDAGTAEGAPATDREGVPRPRGGGVDLGAYER